MDDPNGSNRPPRKTPARKTPSSGRRSSSTLIEGDGDLDEFLPPNRRRGGSGLPAPSSSIARPANPDDDDDLDGPEGGADEGGGPLGAVEMDGFPQHNRKSAELQAQMQAKSTGKPIVPYPPEMPVEHRPYWLELVNSFPADHFQASDTTLMKLYCRAAADIERTTRLIEEEGEVVMGGRGPMVNPRVKVRGDATNTLMTLATKFRNQPASRVNTENFGVRQQKAAAAGNAARTVDGDDDGLLAGGSSVH